MLTPNIAAINTNTGGYDSDVFSDSWNLFDTLSAAEFVIFASCWTLFFVIYLSLTSSTDYTRSHRPIGRIFIRKIVFAVDFLSAIFWFAGFVALALRYRSGPCGYDEASVCDTTITSILVGVCLWYSSSSFILRSSIDKMAGSPFSQQAPWQCVTCFVLAMNVPRSTPMGRNTGFYNASTTII